MTVTQPTNGTQLAPSPRFGRHFVNRIEERDVDLMLLEEISGKPGLAKLIARLALARALNESSWKRPLKQKVRALISAESWPGIFIEQYPWLAKTNNHLYLGSLSTGSHLIEILENRTD